MARYSRRTFFLAAGTVAASSSLLPSTLTPAMAQDRIASAAGTTLESSAVPIGTTGYRRLAAGPGYPLKVRSEALPTPPTTEGTDRRKTLASFVQLTDMHVVDAQSPMRFEYLHDLTGSAFRPQEAFGTQGSVSLIQRINSLGKGPQTGRPLDCVVTTGDSTDNHESVELDWFLTIMNGGSLTPNTGAPDRWEGVQNSSNPQYWLPESDVEDRYKKAGFPVVSDFFARAMAQHSSPGLKFPWFSVFGNHDDSICGTLPSDWAAFRDMYTGSLKFTGFRDATANRQLERQITTDTTQASSAPRVTANKTPKQDFHVTADARRKPFTPSEFMQAHLDHPSPVGPLGNGFTPDHVGQGIGYYSFDIADGVVGIALDSTNRAGFTGGSIGDAQYRWLEQTLRAGSSHWYDGLGVRKTQSAEDTYFIVFSHHTPDTMNNLLLAPGNSEIRHAGWDVANLLTRFPNVLAWVNGHTHTNKITLKQHRTPERSYWEINTASHVDYPQHARTIEVTDNGNGTVSLLTTILESEAPYDGDSAATLYREYSFNDLHADSKLMGTDQDHNTELLLVSPRS